MEKKRGGIKEKIGEQWRKRGCKENKKGKNGEEKKRNIGKERRNGEGKGKKERISTSRGKRN